MDEMKVKIGADLTELVKASASVDVVLADVAKSAVVTQASLSKLSTTSGVLAASINVTGKSFDEVKGSIFAAADAFDKKWDPVVKQAAADAQKAATEVNKLEKAVTHFGGGVAAFKPSPYFDKTADTLTKKVVPGANQASNALMNLGRVAQDAPFGFIGISNNINPLLESFQRLRKETGSNAGALKALGSSLIGGGGLGLAVSVATGLLTVLAANGFFKTKDAIDKTKKSAEDFKKTVDGIFSNAAKEAAEVQSLVAVLKSETATRERKLATIKELQKINPEVFGGLKMEGSLVAGLDTAYQNYIANLRTVIAVKIKQQQLEKVTEEILKKEGITLLGTDKLLSEGTKKVTQSLVERERATGIAGAASKRQQTSEKEINALYRQQSGLLDDITKLESGVKVDAIKDKKVKHQKDYNDVLREMREDLAAITFQFDQGFISSREQDTARIARLKSALKDLFDLKQTAGSKNVIDVSNLIDPVAARLQLDEKLKEVVRTVGRDKTLLPQVTIPVNLKPNINTNLAEVQADFNRQLEGSIALAEKIAPIFDNAFNAVANGQNVFRSIGDSIKQMVVQLAAAAVRAAVFSLVINAITGGGAGAGFSFKSLFSSFSGLPKFAGGVTGFGGGMALVGERGPELVRLPQGSDVIPNHRLDGITGAGAQVFIPNITLRGPDLVVAFDRATQRLGRIG